MAIIHPPEHESCLREILHQVRNYVREELHRHRGTDFLFQWQLPDEGKIDLGVAPCLWLMVPLLVSCIWDEEHGTC